MAAFLLGVLVAGLSWGDPPKTGPKKEPVFCAKFFGETGCSGKPSQAQEQYGEEWAREQGEENRAASSKPAPSSPAATAETSPEPGPSAGQPASPRVPADEPLRDAVADRSLAGAAEPRPNARRPSDKTGVGPVAEAKGTSPKEPAAAAKGLSTVGRTAAAFAPRADAEAARGTAQSEARAPGETLRDSPGHAAPLGAARPGLVTPPRPARPVASGKLDRVFDASAERPEGEPSPEKPSASPAAPPKESSRAPSSPTPSCAGGGSAEAACGSRVPAGGPGLVSEAAKPAEAPAPRADAEAARNRPPFGDARGTAQSEARAPRADAEAARGTAQSEARVFVALELDVSATPGQYRDAVAGLTRDAGFSLDSRFAPVYRGADRDRVSLWGWLPPGKVREVITLKGVERIEAAPQAQTTPARAAPESEWKLVLRLPPQEPAETAMAAALLRLSDIGFSWKRTESRDASGLITIAGTMPTASVRRALSDAAVVRLEPARTQPAPAPPAPLKASAGPGEELGRLLRRHPVLLLLAALFPLIGSLLRSSR